MMKYPLRIYCVVLIAMGCSENKKVTPTYKVNATKPAKEIKEKKPTYFPIEKIIHNSERRKLRYDLDYGFSDKTKLITAEFFERYLENYVVKNIEDFKIEFDEYSRYYYFDFAEFNKFVLFTIIHDDEDGYDNYYHYTYDKETDKIIDVVMIASVGGDGGHGQEEVLLYSNSLKDLLVKTKSEYDNDLLDERHENCYTRSLEIYETKYKFRQNNTEFFEGKIKTIKDTICR